MGSSFAVLRVQLSPVLRFQTAWQWPWATELSDSVGFFRSEEGTQTEDRRKGEDTERGREGGGEPSSSVSFSCASLAPPSRASSAESTGHAHSARLCPLHRLRRSSAPLVAVPHPARCRFRRNDEGAVDCRRYSSSPCSDSSQLPAVRAPEPAPEPECLFVMTAGNAAFVRRRADAGRLRQRQRTRTFTVK